MARPVIADIRAALTARQFPTVTVWNRIEGRPRSTEFGRALRAEVRDPLWMLTRQWQFGEFQAQDAGTPATAKYLLRTSKPKRYRAKEDPPGDLPGGLPLEAVVERRALPFRIGADPVSFDLRLTMGRRWLKMAPGLHHSGYLKRWPIKVPDPLKEADTHLVAHPEVWATMQAVAGRAMDGYELYLHLKAGGHAWDGIGGVLVLLQKQRLDELGERFVAWFEDLITQPAAGHAYDPSRLEHRFDLGAPESGGETVLAAEEYPGGRLDWHGFSYDRSGTALGTTGGASEVIRTVVPGTLRYSGMPHPRLWAMEDGKTDFGAITADTTDLIKMLFLEFALVYSNDWYLLPCDLDDGTLARIDGMVVTDVFGRRHWIEAAGSGEDDDWQRWTMFNLDVQNIPGEEPSAEPVAAVPGLFLPPGMPQVMDGPTLEEVMLIRDENANMVWGIERSVLLATGDPLPGREAAYETLAHRRRLHGPHTRPPASAPIAYEAMNTVPENWIPFIPVHVPDSNREIQLQRGAMPRVLNGQVSPPIKVRPRTTLLREGLDAGDPYFVHEEEVPRAGTRLTAAYNRTRAHDGKPVLWYSYHRMTGRGEGSSSLDWDRLIDQPPST
ncbi:MAG: hypothetical protein GEV11_12550 [Streptosporangiales bacterium]|nr:hypothetical protein [Streptosporangiales bacterium]